MIRLICTQCHAELSVDDAFAGGVCRCQHCGTIQTVPKKAKRDTAPATATKTFYKKPEPGKAGGKNDLEALADAVSTSSGLSSKRLRQKTVDYATPTPSKGMSPIWIATIVAGGVLVIVALGLLFFRGSAATAPMLPARVVVSTPPVGTTGSPSGATQFLGVPIDAASVIYVLDRGSGTSDWFSYLLEATFRSTATLGGDRKFQIIFWSNGDDEAAFPSSPQFATDSTVAAARKALDSLAARGQSDPTEALKKAFAAHPDLVILATGKGSQLDHSFTEQVLALRGSEKARIDTFSIADSDIGAGLSDLAKQTGGTATLISDSDLKRFAKE